MSSEQFDLSKISTRAPTKFDKDKTKENTQKLVTKISDLQNVLYAERKWSLLIVIQGMDASGKDGLVKKVFEGVNPLGCRVQPFKAPTEEELAHDFLWRVHKHTPERGMIQIFNRSHFEDVLITRVHGWISDEIARKRFDWINSFEESLQERGTIILKFYLHISQEEQLQRFQDRLKDPRKNWKFNPKDIEESKFWKKYRDAYEAVLRHCSPQIPWTVIPADQNWYKEYLAAKTIVETLDKLDMKYPKAASS